MGKIAIYILMIIFLSMFCYASQSELEQASVIGDSIDRYLENEETFNYEEEIRLLQEINGQEAIQVGLKQVLIEQQKIWVLKKTSELWEIIAGVFIMFFHIIKMFVYVMEVWFISIILFRFIPKVLTKVRDSILKWYTKTLN